MVVVVHTVCIHLNGLTFLPENPFMSSMMEIAEWKSNCSSDSASGPSAHPTVTRLLRSLSRARPESELNNVSMELSIVDVSGRCFRWTAVSRAGFKILINAPCPEVYRRMLTFSVGQHLTLFTSPRSRRKWRTQLPLQKLLSSNFVRI